MNDEDIIPELLIVSESAAAQGGAGGLADADPLKTGHLMQEAQHALLELLAKGSILRKKRPKTYDAFVRWRSDIETVLRDLELKIILDDVFDVVVLIRPEAEPEDDDSPVLIRTRTLTENDTLVLLVLRSHFREREFAGDEMISCTLDQVMSWLVPFTRLSNKQSTETSHVRSTLERIKDFGLLYSLRGEVDHWEISPSIRTVIDPDWMTQLLAEYKRVAQEGRPHEITDGK